MDRNLSKKILLTLLKYIPWIMAIGYLICVILSAFGLSTAILTNVFGVTLLPMLLIISCSFALGFCIWHRLPIYFMFVSDCINLYDYLVGIPIGTLEIVSIYLCLFAITVLLCAYLKNRYNVKKRNTQKDTN